MIVASFAVPLSYKEMLQILWYLSIDERVDVSKTEAAQINPTAKQL